MRGSHENSEQPKLGNWIDWFQYKHPGSWVYPMEVERKHENT